MNMTEPVKVLEMIPTVSAFMKTSVGVANNAAWLVCLDAFDAIQQHPNYRNRVKKAYKDAIERFHRYERTLIHAQVNRLFHVDDLAEDTRKQFGENITDRDYYDMWCASGAMAYMKTRPLITSLWNKYRLSLINHKVPHADLLAWPMTAFCVLKIADRYYKAACHSVVREWHVPQRIIDVVFRQLSIHDVTKSWQTALLLTNPEVMEYELDEIEERNIMHGIQQLEHEWAKPEIMIGSIYQAVKDYAENFSDKKTHKSVMKRILEIKRNTENDRQVN